MGEINAERQAAIEGEIAGAAMSAAALNPYTPDSIEYHEWLKGWRRAVGRALMRANPFPTRSAA